MSLNLSTLGITNSIIDLQNQINNVDVDTSDKQDLITSSSDITLNELNSFSVITSELQTDFSAMNGTLNAPQIEVSGDIYIDGVSVLTKFANKQDLITPSTEIETLNITSNINLIDNIDPNNYAVLSYNTFNNKQDLITQGTTLNGFNIAGSSNINFFNPANQLDVQQLNYGIITDIGTTLSTLSTSIGNFVGQEPSRIENPQIFASKERRR